MNVLVVDDEADVRNIVSDFLDRYASEHGLPVSVKALGDPIQGMFEVTANGGDYDIIVLDVRLPKLTGDEIYSGLRHVSPELVDRVLFITGFDDDLHAHFPGEQLRILNKPFRYPQLVEHIAAIVSPD